MTLTLINTSTQTGDSLSTAFGKVNAAIQVLKDNHSFSFTGVVIGNAIYIPETETFQLVTSFSSTVWTADNDGANSDLDAGLLAGQRQAFYLNASNLTTGTIDSARLPTTINASTLNNQNSSYYTNASNLNTGTVPLARLPAGTAGGIDAAKIAGNDITKIPLLASANKFTANNTINTVVCGVPISGYSGLTLDGWATGEYLIIAAIASDPNTYISARTNGNVVIAPDKGNTNKQFVISINGVTFAGNAVYTSANLVRGIEDTGQAITLSYDSNNRIKTITSTISSKSAVHTFTYSGSTLSNVTITYDSITRTYSYIYTSGKLTSIMINE